MGLSEQEKAHISRLSEWEKRKCEQLVRDFCAQLIEGKVANDGQVKGWHHYLSSLHPEAQRIVENHYQWVCAKVVLRGEDEAGVIARGLVSVKHALATFRPTPGMTVEPREIEIMMSGIGKALGWQPEPPAEATEAAPEPEPTEFRRDDPSTYGYGLGPNGE